MKFIVTALLPLALFLSATAQPKTGSIKGSLKDSLNKQELSLATVTIFKAQDTSLITYRLSDPQGNFRVPSLPLDILSRVLITFSGYRVFRKEFLLTKESPNLDLGTIFLVNDPKNLDEVIVLAERPPVTVRKDTIEFNASAFKTLPSALVEDLLKKLPGVDVDTDGNITVKGKRVNRLLVDGKEFFGGDPKVATKNLPANIVDKVQVMNDKEEMDRNPEMPESEVGQVVNIKLKKAIKQGWFGKAYAGVGTDERNEIGAILNMFRDTTQVSVLGYTNNINKPGFGITDIQKIGGFERSGISSMMVNRDGGFALNDVSFGATGQGLQRSTGGGFNFNNQFGKKVTMNLQYFYGQVNSDFSTLSTQQRFFGDTILSTFNDSRSNNISRNHRIGGSVVWKIDSTTTLTFRPGLTLTTNDNHSAGKTETEENFRGKINSSESQINGAGQTDHYSHNLFLNKNFRKRGRMFTVSSNLSIGKNLNDTYNDGVFSFHSTGLTEDSLVNQLRHTGGNNLRNSVMVSFAEPLSKKVTFRASHNAEYLKEGNDIDFFSKDRISGKYDQFNQNFSNGIERNGWKNTTSASFTFRSKKFSINPGINLLTAFFDNQFTKNVPVAQRFRYINPSLNVNWGTLGLNYRAYIQEPGAYELQEVIDISNRFYQQFGNPNLKPSVNHTLQLNTYKFNPKSGNSFSVYLSGNYNEGAVIRETTIDRNGVQTTRPVNIDGTFGLYSSMMYNYQYKINQDLRFSIRPSFYINYSSSLISVNRNRSEATSFIVNPSLSLALNYKDKIELNQRYSHSYRENRYENKTAYRNIYIPNHSVESEVVIRMPKHVVWENLINYYYNPQVAPGIRKSNIRWNAGVSYLFLKEEKGQIKLSVYDLLNQNISVNRYASENYIIDAQHTTLTRYFMLSFIYNLRTFTGGKVGGKDRGMFWF